MRVVLPYNVVVFGPTMLVLYHYLGNTYPTPTDVIVTFPIQNRLMYKAGQFEFEFEFEVLLVRIIETKIDNPRAHTHKTLKILLICIYHN